MHLATWCAISMLRQTREPLLFWRHILGADFEKVQPFLVVCEGLAGSHIPCSDTGIRLEIRETHGGYRAGPAGEYAEDAEDRSLRWDEAQAWEIDGEKLRGALCEVLGLAGVAGTADDAVNRADVQLVGVCERSGVRRRVYLCHAPNSESAALLAADAAHTPNAGCILFPERHLAAEHVLNGRGVAGVALAECVTWAGGKWVGGCGEVCKGAVVDISHAELRDHFDRRFDRVGREFADLESENKQLKQDLAQVLANVSRQVEPEFFQWIFVILGTGSVNAAARVLKVPGSTFAGRLKEYADRGGLYETLFSMVAARRKGVGQRRIERFNEMFKEHQGVAMAATPDVLMELLDGLESLNAANWKELRKELIAVVRGELPEDSS